MRFDWPILDMYAWGPRVWFPCPSPPGIAIALSLGGSLEGHVWELAHESVHLLDPWNPSCKKEGCSTNCLEEGLATWFQNRAVQDGGNAEIEYARRERLVAPLMH